mgnify:CR=1 FL=1
MNALFPDIVVNDETIAPTAIAAKAQYHTGPGNKPGIAWRKIAQALEKAGWTKASRDCVAGLAVKSDIRGSSLDPA